jgi:NADH-quinone oxidoreductase subunit M
MVNHGLVVAPLLFIVGLLARRAGGSEDIRDMGGIAFRAPVLATLFLIVALATLAIPGSSNFVGEFLILLGVFKAKLVIALIASSGVVMASVYALRLLIRAMHNRVGAKVHSQDIRPLDGLVLAGFVAVILFLGFYPQLALHRSEGSVKTAVFEAQALAANPHAQFHLFSGTAGAAALSTTRTGTVPATSESSASESSEGSTGEASEGATGESSGGATR